MHRFLLAAASLVFASSAFAEPPAATVSDYLVTESAGFVGDSNKGGGFGFSIILSAGSLLTEKRYAVASFENPGGDDVQLEVPFDADPAQSSIVVNSPVIHRWKNNHRYGITIRVYEDEAHTVLLGTHVQELDFAIPEKVAETYQVELL